MIFVVHKKSFILIVYIIRDLWFMALFYYFIFLWFQKRVFHVKILWSSVKKGELLSRADLNREQSLTKLSPGGRLESVCRARVTVTWAPVSGHRANGSVKPEHYAANQAQAALVAGGWPRQRADCSVWLIPSMAHHLGRVWTGDMLMWEWWWWWWCASCTCLGVCRGSQV